MKQNFFDHLDGGWGDVIANTYKDYNKITYKIKNVSAIADQSTIQVKDYNYAYEEKYLTTDKKFILRLFIRTGKYYNFRKLEKEKSSFGINLEDSKLEREISSFGIILEDSESNERISYYDIARSRCNIDIAPVYKRHACDSGSDENIEIDKKFIFDFIDRACKCINKNHYSQPIQERTIEQLIEIINSETIDS